MTAVLQVGINQGRCRYPAHLRKTLQHASSPARTMQHLRRAEGSSGFAATACGCLYACSAMLQVSDSDSMTELVFADLPM